MTACDKVHDTHLIFLVLLGLKKYEIFTNKFCQIKQLTPISNELHFQGFKLFEGDKFFMWYSQMHTL